MPTRPRPASYPTLRPTKSPSTPIPTDAPTRTSTDEPTRRPTDAPTQEPTSLQQMPVPTRPWPTPLPSSMPSVAPTLTPKPSTATPRPTTQRPSLRPTLLPTLNLSSAAHPLAGSGDNVASDDYAGNDDNDVSNGAVFAALVVLIAVVSCLGLFLAWQKWQRISGNATAISERSCPLAIIIERDGTDEEAGGNSPPPHLPRNGGNDNGGNGGGAAAASRAVLSEPSHRCIICMDRPCDTRLEPCGHADFCGQCIARIISDGGQCPYCRSDIRTTTWPISSTMSRITAI